jgi:hypothetical protein
MHQLYFLCAIVRHVDCVGENRRWNASLRSISLCHCATCSVCGEKRVGEVVHFAVQLQGSPGERVHVKLTLMLKLKLLSGMQAQETNS